MNFESHEVKIMKFVNDSPLKKNNIGSHYEESLKDN